MKFLEHGFRILKSDDASFFKKHIAIKINPSLAYEIAGPIEDGTVCLTTKWTYLSEIPLGGNYELIGEAICRMLVELGEDATEMLVMLLIGMHKPMQEHFKEASGGYPLQDFDLEVLNSAARDIHWFIQNALKKKS